jgi:hypothetical protein
MNHRLLIPTCTALVLIATCVLTGCPTGPIQTNNPAPPTTSWSILDQTTRLSQNLTPAGSGITVFITPGDNYMVVFQATSPSGIKTTSLSGKGSVICHNNRPPYSESDPFAYTIPDQTITPTVQPGQQAFTQVPNPYFFLWGPGPPPAQGQPAFNGPALTAYEKCGAQLPLLGTTTYTGVATSFSNVSSSPSSLSVTTCASGLTSSPSITCGP